MTQFSVHDAKTDLSRRIADALADGDVPVVRLVPVNARGRRLFGASKGKIAMDGRFDEPLPDDELSGWNMA